MLIPKYMTKFTKILKLGHIIIIFTLFLGPIILVHVDALQQSADPIVVDIKPGETQHVTWGLKSDNENEIINVDIKAEGDGSEFLSFRKTLELEPNQPILWTTITVNIPEDYPGGIELTPSLFATTFQPMEGQISFNIVMKKTVYLNIAPNDDPSLWVNWETIKNEEVNEVVTQSEPTSSDGDGSAQEQGGCLIATATYGSELASQVQLLREIRDDKLLSTSSGSSFMTGFNSFYYSFSPTIADLERQNPAFKELVKITITPLLTSLSILNYVDVDSEAEMLGWGLSLIVLNVGMYIAAPLATVFKVRKHLINTK